MLNNPTFFDSWHRNDSPISQSLCKAPVPASVEHHPILLTTSAPQSPTTTIGIAIAIAITIAIATLCSFVAVEHSLNDPPLHNPY